LTLEEKLEHLKNLSMEEARAEGNRIITDYRAALEQVLENHKIDAKKQSEIRIKTESIHAKQQKNQALIKGQLDSKRKYSQLQQELKEKIFDETKEKLNVFMTTKAYEHYLVQKIQSALNFAGNDPIIFYINPTDQDKLATLIATNKADIRISDRDFVGGIRGVIENRHILIDYSFHILMNNAFETFTFGGDGIGRC